MLSRALGFVRDLIFASVFGTGFRADAFFVAFRIPNLLRSFIAEGALTSAFVPTFASELHHSKERAQTTLSNVAGFLLFLTALLTALGMSFAPQIVSFIAPGFEPQGKTYPLCVSLLKIMFPYIMGISMVALAAGALNTVRIFGYAAIAQIVVNITLIIGGVLSLSAKSQAPFILANAVLIGGLLQVLVQIPGLKKAGFHLTPRLKFWSKQVKEVVRLMLPATLGSAVYQLSILANTVFASLLVEGSVAWLFFADRIVQLPIGIFSIALASVLLPTLASAAASNDESKFENNLTNALRFSTIIMLPCAFGLFLFAKPLVSLLFERGAFTIHSTNMTVNAIKAYTIGLWFVSCHTLVIRAFLARKDTITPTLVALFSFVINVCISLSLMGTPQIGSHKSLMTELILTLQGLITSIAPFSYISHFELGHVGLALASSCSAIFSFCILITVLKIRLPEIKFSPVVIAMFKTIAACLVMTIAVYALEQMTELSKLPKLIIGVPLASIVFVSTAKFLKLKELDEATHSLFGKAFQSTPDVEEE